MGDSNGKPAQGTEPAYPEYGEKDFSKISMLLEATGGLSLSQVCAVTGLEASTIQNWVKRGWVTHPKGKKYEEVHVARILIINALKECIKLEHISLLMDYVNGPETKAAGGNIKESELFNYLGEALQKAGQADDLSPGGVESVVEKVISDYEGPSPDARIRIRKALTVMIFACVCTDVKRRTEAMMGQILYDLEHPENILAEILEEQEEAGQEEQQPEDDAEIAETRKTVSQALREWDMNSVERIISEQDDEDAAGGKTADTKPKAEEKSSYRPWYFRKK